MKIFDIITRKRMAILALAASIVSLAGFLAFHFVWTRSGGWDFYFGTVFLPMLLLSGILWVPGRVAAWAGAVLGVLAPAWWLLLLITTLTPPAVTSSPVSPGDAVGLGFLLGLAALTGLAGFVSELPHLHLPHLHHRHASAAGR